MEDSLNRIKEIEEIEKEHQRINGELRKSIQIKEEYLRLIADIGYDYDGCSEAESLKVLIDELVDLARRGLKEDTKSVVYIGGKGKKLNILREEIEENGE